MSDQTPTSEALDEALSALIDGELDAAEEQALRARIDREPALAARLASLENVDVSLRALAAVQPAPDALAALRERLEAEPPDNVRRLPVWVGGAIAAAAAVFAYLLLTPGASEPLAPDAPPVVVAERATETEVAEPTELAALEDASDEEIGIALDYETLSDLDVIEELELLEWMVELEERREQG